MSFRYTESEKQEFNKKQKETKMVCHCGGHVVNLQKKININIL